MARIETRVEALVEGALASLFAGRLRARDVALPLARALEDSAVAGAPATRYAVRMNPADAQAMLGNQPRLTEALAAELIALAREMGLTLPNAPEVVILPDASLKPHSVHVTAEPGADAADATQKLSPLRADAAPAPPGAFLILDGERTVPLAGAVLSLGRRLDNHVILDDPRVSRAHAQLRLRFGRYVVYDLGSGGGTFVNGQRVTECVLRPGDVISLAGVTLIYGEEDMEMQNPKSQTPNPRVG